MLRANRLHPQSAIAPGVKFHSLRHTYASLCVAADIPIRLVSNFMGHSKTSTTETIYTHLLTDDHSEAMAALGAMAAPKPAAAASASSAANNVLQFKR